jgi:hypothetical protein
MANITDPRVTTWLEQRARPISDQAVAFLTKLLAYQTDWAAQGINALVVAGGNANLIADGSVTGPDGRQQVTGLTLQNLKTCIDQIVTAMNVTNVIGVGSPPSTTVNAIQVNGSPR